MFTIYGLIDPRTGQVRYVGATTKTKTDRLAQHYYSAEKLNKRSNRDKWLRELKEAGFDPVFCTLEVCSDTSWKEKEKLYISIFPNLTNVQSGGSNMYTKTQRPEESITRSSEAHKIPIIQLDMVGNFIRRWDSIVNAADHYNILTTAIGNVLAERTVSTNGYRWVYEKDYHPEMSFRKDRSKRACTVVFKNTGKEKVYPGISDCARALNLSSGALSQSFTRKGKWENDQYLITRN